jgi:hypothetical protein
MSSTTTNSSSSSPSAPASVTASVTASDIYGRFAECANLLLTQARETNDLGDQVSNTEQLLVDTISRTEQEQVRAEQEQVRASSRIRDLHRPIRVFNNNNNNTTQREQLTALRTRNATIDNQIVSIQEQLDRMREMLN